MKIIGITGGVVTGKTTVARLFSSLLEAEIIDADEIVHELFTPHGEIWQKVVQFFGNDILKNDSSIDRRKLGKTVFSDTSKRKRLESIIHPAVKEVIEEKIKQFKKNGKKWVVIDMPLLFEAKMEHIVDRIIVVIRSEGAQLDTLQKEDGLSLKEAKERIGSQLPLSEKVKRANFVVDNNGTLQNTEKQVREICAHLKHNFDI